MEKLLRGLGEQPRGAARGAEIDWRRVAALSINAPLQPVPLASMAPIPDPDGKRFCRQCACYLPLCQFHGGARRYECKKHALERARVYRARQRGQCPGCSSKVVLQRIWHALYDDTKRAVFRQGHKKVGMTQADVLKIFAERGVKPDLQWRVVPREPGVACGLDNAAIVSRDIRRELVAALEKEGRERYRELLFCQT
mmetsp:Transcript_41667/g.97255  ORF Transcript_41667/g.97255 Transcript_41667/m.97255 type:complete len:197 (+) Transcript_41667:57-647(+)